MPRKPAAGQQQLGVARIKKLPTPPLSRQNCARAAQKARREVVCRRQMKQKPRPDSEIGFVREDRLRAFEPIFETLHAYPSINPRHYKILHAHSYAKRLTSENIPRLHGRPCAVVKDMSVLDAALDLAGLISKRAEQDEAEARKNVLWRRAHAVHGQERIDPYRPVPQPIVILNVSFDESLSPPGGLAGIGNSLPDKKLNMREDLYFRTSLPMCFESDPRAPQAADEESMFMPDVAEAAEAAEAENAEDAANDEALPPPTTSMQEWRPPSLIPGRILYTPQVVVTRKGEEQNYIVRNSRSTRRAPRPPVFSVITVPSCPWANKDSSASLCDQTGEGERELKKGCILSCMRKVLRTAVYNNHQSIVLGTMGLGNGDGTSPVDIANWWQQILLDKEFRGRNLFRDIWFAVSDR